MNIIELNNLGLFQLCKIIVQFKSKKDKEKNTISADGIGKSVEWEFLLKFRVHGEDFILYFIRKGQ